MTTLDITDRSLGAWWPTEADAEVALVASLQLGCANLPIRIGDAVAVACESMRSTPLRIEYGAFCAPDRRLVLSGQAHLVDPVAKVFTLRNFSVTAQSGVDPVRWTRVSVIQAAMVEAVKISAGVRWPRPAWWRCRL